MQEDGIAGNLEGVLNNSTNGTMLRSGSNLS